MDLTGMTQAITTIGFPIFMCLLLFWYMKENNADHKDEVSNLTEAINNNTLVMTKLVDRLGEKL